MKKLVLILAVLVIAIGPLFVTGCRRRDRRNPPGTRSMVEDPGWTETIEDSVTTKRETRTEMTK